MRVLVAGADRVDAGKTTFATGLLARLGGVGFKPRAGNDYWFDHDDYLAAIDEGRLYGKDAARLAGASHRPVEIEQVNPIHRLWRPSPGGGTGLVGRADREFVCDRVAGSFVVNGSATVPDSVRNALPVEDAVTVSSIGELNEVTRRRHLPALEAVAERIRETDPAVVESYGDVARPLEGVLDGDAAGECYDAVAVVDPGRVRVFDAARYVRAAAVAGGSPRDGRMECRVGDVIEHVDPLETVELPPLPADERTDPSAVADAYARIYDRILRTCP